MISYRPQLGVAGGPMSTPAAHFEKALQSPPHAKPNQSSQDHAHSFMNRIWTTSTAERVADES